MTLPVSLRTDIDASYADTGDPSRKLHQQNHDAVHALYNALVVDGGGGVGTIVAATHQWVVDQITALIGGAPGALDTLNELATALGDDASFATTVTNALATKAARLTRTAVRTANYTAAAGDLVPCDTTSAAITVTLPSAPAVGSRVAVKLVTLGAGHAVTVACGGSDVFNKTAGATTASLTLLNQAIQVQYDTGGIWTVVADDIPKSQLDATYVTLGRDRTSVKDPNLSTVAAGDGVTDDTAAFVAARTAAGVNGKVFVPPGTYLVTGLVLGVAGQDWELDPRATVTLAAGSGNHVLSVTAANVTVAGGIIDGNKAAAASNGQHVIYWTGTGGVLRRTTAQNGKSCGVLADSSGTVDCYDVTSTLNTNDGFDAKASAVIRLWGACQGSSNGRHGAFFQSTAADGCRVEGKFNSNTQSGVYIASQNGRGGHIDADDDGTYGVALDTVTGWLIDSIASVDVGKTAANGAATAVECFGVDHCTIGQITSIRPLGYGLAISKNTSNVGSSYNNFPDVTVDHTNATDRDPGIHIGEASHHNAIGVANVRKSTVALIFGEGTTGNDYNRVGLLLASQTEQAALRIDGGVGNTIDRIVARDIQCNNATYKGVVSFTTANATDNIVGSVDYEDTGLAVGNPPYIAYADASAVRNEVRDGKARNFATGIALDSNGGNSLLPRRPRRPSQAGTSSIWIPGVDIFNVSTDALAANTLYYWPFEVEGQDLTLATLWFEVTAAPASNANTRLGIYRADANLQPLGSPLADVTKAVPTTGGVAVYNVAATPVLKPGVYLFALMMDQAMTLRVMLGGGKHVGCVSALGATPFVSRVSVANTYGTMPDPPVLWTTVTNGASPSRCPILVRATTT